MEDFTSLLKLVYNSRGNIIDMIKDRGFNVNSIKKYSIDELKILLEAHLKAGFENLEKLSALDIFVENDDRKLIVKYKLDDRFKKTRKLQTQIDNIYDEYELTKNDCLILLYNDNIIYKDDMKPSNIIIKYINKEYENGKFIQIYGLENFKINISKHIIVPKHTIVSKEKRIEVLQKYFTKIENLPRILREDPMAKYIGALPNDLIEIKVYNETSGFTTQYRLCVNVM